ncbi:MAG: MFS transporter [Candidatus Dormibacteraeota bacterium]|nr:MFS transporter [Candidatus Dormibacteraeota bacterium]
MAALAVCISGAFQILLPVVPVMAERSGPHGVGGAATAALFIGAVVGELLTPWLMSRLRSTHLLVAGQLLTAVPSLVYVFPHPEVWAMITAASARGLGMGVAIVVSVALLSDLTGPQSRGRSIGYYGLALSGPGIFVPSIGVFLLASGRADVDALIAFATALLGALIAFKIPEHPAPVAKRSTNLLGAVMRPGLLIVFAGFVLTSCSFGGVITYAPLALPLDGLGSAASFLLVSGAARAASRWLAGVLSDRRPTRNVLIGGMAVSLAGLIVLALHGAPATVLVAAVAYGAGFGATQTSAFLLMSERGTSSDSGAISALWNCAIDLGGSLGGAMIGLAAASYGYVAAAWILPAVVATSLPLFLWPARPTSPPLAEAEIYVR